MQKNQELNKTVIFQDYLNNKHGLFVIIAYSILLWTLNTVIDYTAVNTWIYALFELISIALSGAYFLVYLRVSNTGNQGDFWHWFSVLTASLIMALLVWSNGALSWLWFSPLYVAYQVPQIFGTDTLAAFIVFLCELIVCSICFTLIVGKLMKASTLRKQLTKNAPFLLLTSATFSVLLVLTSLISGNVNMPYPLYTALTVLPQAIAFGLLFHIVNVRTTYQTQTITSHESTP